MEMIAIVFFTLANTTTNPSRPDIRGGTVTSRVDKKNLCFLHTDWNPKGVLESPERGWNGYGLWLPGGSAGGAWRMYCDVIQLMIFTNELQKDLLSASVPLKAFHDKKRALLARRLGCFLAARQERLQALVWLKFCWNACCSAAVPPPRHTTSFKKKGSWVASDIDGIFQILGQDTYWGERS
jgi:hypothetical protein